MMPRKLMNLLSCFYPLQFFTFSRSKKYISGSFLSAQRFRVLRLSKKMAFRQSEESWTQPGIDAATFAPVIA
jgi:hypothetical protein